MSESTRRILLSCLVILAIACLCVGILGVIELGLLNVQPAIPVSQVTPTNLPSSDQPPLPTPDNPTPIPTLPTATQKATSTQDLSAQTIPTAPTIVALPAEISSGMDQIQEQVIQIRGLQASAPVRRALLSQEELKEKVKTDLLVDYTQQDAWNDVRLYASLGLLDSNLDFYQFYQDLLGEQVAGYYDEETKEMYVIQGEGFNGAERFTYAHEYDHALQDQNYDLEKGLNLETDLCKQEGDRCLAAQALIEGDATIASLNWLSSFGTKKDIQDLLEVADGDTPIFNQAPSFIQKDFLFPYQQGQVFVQALFDRGGWQAVNQAFQNPPITTEQVLHPARYPDDRPLPVALPDLGPTLGSEWQKVKETTLGEWYTYLLLVDGKDEQWRLDDSKAQRAAEGWGGDDCQVYTNRQNQTILILQTQWDNTNEAAQFAAAVQDYASRRYQNAGQNLNGVQTWQGQAEVSLFRLDDDRTTWVIAPDQTTAEHAWQTIK